MVAFFCLFFFHLFGFVVAYYFLNILRYLHLHTTLELWILPVKLKIVKKQSRTHIICPLGSTANSWRRKGKIYPDPQQLVRISLFSCLVQLALKKASNESHQNHLRLTVNKFSCTIFTLITSWTSHLSLLWF